MIKMISRGGRVDRRKDISVKARWKTTERIPSKGVVQNPKLCHFWRGVKMGTWQSHIRVRVSLRSSNITGTELRIATNSRFA